MASFKDTGPAFANQGWIHELARAEVHPDAERLLQLGKAFDPQQLVEESTIDFMTEIREHFNDYARIFNGFSEGGAKFQDVKVYSLAQTSADFMVFRNGVKLVVSNTVHGMIQFMFAQHVRTTMSVDGQNSTTAQLSQAVPSQSQELLAQVGPFRDVFWTFQGEKVQPEQVARFYFSEFIRATRDAKKSRAGNQLLLDQIKALLQEKGLDL